MSTDIAVNDLVYVAKPMPCCGSTVKMGYVFQVKGIETVWGGDCYFCGKHYRAPVVALDAAQTFFADRLRKFDPKSEPDRIEEIALLVIGELATMGR